MPRRCVSLVQLQFSLDPPLKAQVGQAVSPPVVVIDEPGPGMSGQISKETGNKTACPT
jgi:hypothetical protein